MTKGAGIAVAIGAVGITGGLVWYFTRDKVGNPPTKANDNRGPKCGDIVGAGLQLGSQVAAQSAGAPPSGANLTSLGAPVCKAGEALGKAFSFLGKNTMKGGKAVYDFAGPVKIGKGAPGTVTTIAAAPVTAPIKASVNLTKGAFKEVKSWF